MTARGDRVPSGVPDLDDLHGGLILGDNVVWVVDGDRRRAPPGGRPSPRSLPGARRAST